MGEIWVSRNEMTGADVALKVLRGDLERRDETEARFRHEAQLGATLSHRNIVKVFDLLIEPDGTLILVMELLRGVTLRRALALRAQPMNGNEAVAVMLPILSALQHAHDNAVVHRDLKPANILLAVDPDGHITPKLLDFGIAKVAGSGVRTLFGRVLGTPRYMSPEQIRADPKIDGRSDQFSAAILLIEMMTGASPFRASTPSASLAAVLEQEVDPDPRIDPRLWLVIKRALAKRPYERYSSASEFAAALRQATGLTDAELGDMIQKAAPVTTSGNPSYSDIAPSLVEDDLDEDGDGGGSPAVSEKRLATDPSLRGKTHSNAPGALGSDTIGSLGAVALPRRNMKWVAGVAASVGLLLVAFIGFSMSSKPKKSTLVPLKPTAAEVAPVPSDIPAPPSTDSVEFFPATSADKPTKPTTHATKAATPSTKTTTPTSSKTTPPAAADKSGKRRPVASTPDF